MCVELTQTMLLMFTVLVFNLFMITMVKQTLVSFLSLSSRCQQIITMFTVRQETISTIPPLSAALGFDKHFASKSSPWPSLVIFFSLLLSFLRLLLSHHSLSLHSYLADATHNKAVSRLLAGQLLSAGRKVNKVM